MKILSKKANQVSTVYLPYKNRKVGTDLMSLHIKQVMSAYLSPV